MNNAWQYCENITPTEPEKALSGACLSALLTIEEFRRKGLGPGKRGLAKRGGRTESGFGRGRPPGRPDLTQDQRRIEAGRRGAETPRRP